MGLKTKILTKILTRNLGWFSTKLYQDSCENLLRFHKTLVVLKYISENINQGILGSYWPKIHQRISQESWYNFDNRPKLLCVNILDFGLGGFKFWNSKIKFGTSNFEKLFWKSSWVLSFWSSKISKSLLNNSDP